MKKPYSNGAEKRRIISRCDRAKCLAYWRWVIIDSGRGRLRELVVSRLRVTYRRFSGQSSGCRLGQVTTTSIRCSKPPHARHLEATVNALENIANVNVLKVTASFVTVTAHYKMRRFWRFSVITM